MYLLNRLILIDSYKPGELVEVRLDGHTNLNGVNGAGKTRFQQKQDNLHAVQLKLQEDLGGAD